MKKLVLALPVFLMITCLTVAAQAQDKAAAPAEAVAGVNVDVAAAVSNDGTVYVLKEFTVDVVTKFSPEDIDKMKTAAAEDIKKIGDFKAQYNKEGATEKEKKAALKGIQEILNKRADAYFAKLDEKVNYVKGLVKDSENSIKAEKKNQKKYVENEAENIVNSKAPDFRIPKFSCDAADKAAKEAAKPAAAATVAAPAAPASSIPAEPAVMKKEEAKPAEVKTEAAPAAPAKEEAKK